MKRIGELRKLAMGLMRVDANKFDLNFWGAGDGVYQARDLYKCGTSACAIGWLPKLVPESKLRMTKDPATKGTIRPEFKFRNKKFTGWHAVAVYFGLTRLQARNLFAPETYPRDKRSAKDVSERISLVLSFIENNE